MVLHDTAHNSNSWLDGWHIETGLVSFVGLLILIFTALSADRDAVAATLAMIVAFSPIWLPINLFFVWWPVWMHYVRFRFWFAQKMVLLHIELPPEVEKSPLAMELFLIALWNSGGESTFLARIWKGQFRAVTTLELVSNGGRIGYYIHVRQAWKDTVEARLYGQFPEARVTVVPDYVDQVPYTPETHGLWGLEFKKSGAEALPIKTYIDWELNQNPDTPETKVDPMTHIFEFLGSIGPDEHVWIQIVMKARKKDEWYGFYGGDHFKDDANAEIKKITKDAITRGQGLTEDPDEKKKIGARGATLLTGGEKFKVEAIERSMGKQVFDCGFRALYIAKGDKFNGARIGNVVNLWSPFRGMNSLGGARGKAIFDYPWQDWGGVRDRMISRKLFFWYKHRAYFYVPYDQDAVCLTTEELASIWHFPNSAVKTPALQRVPSRVSEAPANLPTGTPANLPS